VVGLVVAVVSGCAHGSATGNLSTVAPSSGAGTTAPAASASPSNSAPVLAGIPADVPLTGHNVKPGEKPPRYPAAALTNSQAGANAFAEFFMKTLDWAYATTNPSYMKHYYGPTCGLCAGIAEGISKTATAHEWYEGGRLTVRSASAQRIGSVTAPSDFCSTVVVDIGTTTVVDGSGKIHNAQVALTSQSFKSCERWSDHAWSISYFIGTTS
jgi:hypothetical protein